MRYGSAGAPTWVTTLILAEKWGVLPSDVERMPGGVKWAKRQAALDEARRQSAEMGST